MWFLCFFLFYFWVDVKIVCSRLRPLNLKEENTFKYDNRKEKQTAFINRPV